MSPEPAPSQPEPDETAVAARDRDVRQSAVESHAQRVARELREAEREAAREESLASRATRDAAKRAQRDAKRAKRREVRRFTRVRRERFRRVLIGAGVVVGSFALLLALVYSPLMAIRTIEVRGTERVDAAEIEAALASLDGAPIATVREADVTRELSQFRALQTVAVDIVPPSTIVVRVVERTPIAVLDGALIDPAGVALGAPLESDPRLPQLRGVEPGSAAFTAVARALAAMPQHLREQIQTIEAPTPDAISMQLSSGSKVEWGGASQSALKATVLEALIAGAPASVYDVSAPEHPITR